MRASTDQFGFGPLSALATIIRSLSRESVQLSSVPPLQLSDLPSGRHRGALDPPPSQHLHVHSQLAKTGEAAPHPPQPLGSAPRVTGTVSAPGPGC